jgi:hypothetical protein
MSYFGSFNMWLLIRSSPAGGAGVIDLIRKKFFENDETVCSCTSVDTRHCFADKYANNL